MTNRRSRVAIDSVATNLLAVDAYGALSDVFARQLPSTRPYPPDGPSPSRLAA